MLTTILNIPDNRANLRRLTDQLRTPSGITPFVGAGLSIPLGFPGWSAFLIAEGQTAGIREKVQQRVTAGEYEEAADDVLAAIQRRAFEDHLEDKFGDLNLRDQDLPLQAVWLLPQIAAGPVVTTNFDHVLERAFKNSGYPFEHEVWGAKAGMVAKAFYSRLRFLFKIHGDVGDATDRILTKGDYDRHYGHIDPSSPERQHLPRLLENILAGYNSLLFIGCSLNRDRILRILRSVVSRNPEVAHYAIVERPTPPDTCLERSRYLSEHGIRPIWYPKGQHESITLILGYLAAEIQPHSRPRASRQQTERPAERVMARPLWSFGEPGRQSIRAPGGNGRFEAFLHESGHSGFPRDADSDSWYFGILGCVFSLDDYRLTFELRVEELKERYFGKRDRDHSVILDRVEIKGGRKAFASLQDEAKRAAFNTDLLTMIESSLFQIIVVVLDKRAFVARVGRGADPRVCCFAELLDRYCAFLVSGGVEGDVIGEARKKHLDRVLTDAFELYWREIERRASSTVPLRSKRLKLKPRETDVVGLQMASLLAHPAKQSLLHEMGLVQEVGAFTALVAESIRKKYLDGGRVLIR